MTTVCVLPKNSLVSRVFTPLAICIGHTLIDNALKAHYLYKRDVNYVVQPHPESRQQEIIIVDEFTGRLMPGRQWSDGLHQAIEAKEGVPIKKQSQNPGDDYLAELFQALLKSRV